MEKTRGGTVLAPHSRAQQDVALAPECVAAVSVDPQDSGSEQKVQKEAADSLFQVIEKLSRIVGKQSRRCSLSGRKRPRLPCPPVTVRGTPGQSGEVPLKKAKSTEGTEGGGGSQDGVPEEIHLSEGAREGAVTFFQCGLCKFTSPLLPVLKEHIQQAHQQQSDVILMCAECSFTSQKQEELEAHIMLHLDNAVTMKDPVLEPASDMGRELDNTTIGAEGIPVKDRVVKVTSDTTEGKPAKKKWYSQEQYGTYRCLICSYVCGQQRMLKTHAWKHAGLVDCSYPIFEDESKFPSVRGPARPPSPPQEAILVLTTLGSELEMTHGAPTFELKLCTKEVMPGENQAGEGYMEASVTKEPVEEMQVAVENVMEVEHEQNPPGCTDGLLSSAQKIISCSPNTAGHLNVIVERLPEASKPFLLPLEKEENERQLQEQAQHECGTEQEEAVLSGSGGVEEETTVGEQEIGENIPPARKRTQSECLRLHSLAAEALVAMPMRAPEPAKAHALSATIPITGQHLTKIAAPSALHSDPPSAEKQSYTAVVPREGAGKGSSKAGISTSLLTVIEKLQERTDQNASDEDILKELWDDAQSPVGGEAGLPEGSLVEVDPGSERPYRCRLCRYGNTNKGYAKQHLHTYSQRQPYQCPICEHVAADSKDLENHMVRRCKSRMHLCKLCNQAFCCENQLRNHEKDQHERRDALATAMLLDTTMATTQDSEGKIAIQDPSRVQKVYRCDVCDYSSSTYVGVRNHRRIHNSDKPYRCCSCDFATTNMNSLRGHMRKHPQELQGMQLLEQYRCSLCGYVCSHPPSLKSHMWKHAGDQNYNYEQVNKAIDEAISHSSRALVVHQKPMSVVEPSLEKARSAEEGLEKAMPHVDSPAAGGSGMLTESPPGWTRISRSPATPRKVSAPSWPGTEYCVLLFCCCICGFESTSKEQLMQHMKDHEGEIISIILSREQQGSMGTAPPAGQ